MRAGEYRWVCPSVKIDCRRLFCHPDVGSRKQQMNSPRPVTADDLPQVIDLLDTIFRREKGIVDQSVLSDFPLVFAAGNLQNCRVICHDGRVISHAAVWPRTMMIDGHRVGVGIIVLVATARDARHRGHAAALMKDLQDSMPALGCDIGLLWTGVPGFYQRLGWTLNSPPGWFATGSTAAVATTTSIIDYRPSEHLSDLHNLQQAGSIHASRTMAETGVLLSLPKCHVSVAVDGDRPGAYLVEGRAINKQGLIEYAGPPELVWSLVSRAASRTTTDSRLVVFPTHASLATFARDVGWQVQPLTSSKGLGDEMVLVLNPKIATPQILDRLFAWGLDQA
jgi:predicted N-acetyltransferase YhbS